MLLPIHVFSDLILKSVGPALALCRERRFAHYLCGVAQAPALHETANETDLFSSFLYLSKQFTMFDNLKAEFLQHWTKKS